LDVQALELYLKETRDYGFLDARVQRRGAQRPETVLEIISGVFEALKNGIACEDRCGSRVQTVRVRMDADGLIAAGDENMNLTWMDAQPEDGSGKPTTSRHGKAVEINALWHDALEMMADILEQRGDVPAGRSYRALAVRARRSFQKFWNAEKQCLCDIIDGDPRQSAQVRPNQVFGLHLLDKEKARLALGTIRDELLTPFGLRTLSPKDPAYRPEHRDEDYIRSYHQGTVWPWLMMGFVQAAVYAYGRQETQRILEEAGWFDALEAFLNDGTTLHSVPEILNGSCEQPGHWNRKGCPAQAWSVAAAIDTSICFLNICKARMSPGFPKRQNPASGIRRW
jgi:glycogen debranching enzyme